MKIKPSRYNFFFKVKRRNYLAFNAMTGGMLDVPKKDYQKINKYRTTIKPYLKELLEAQSLKSNKSHNGSNTHFLYTNVVNGKSVVNSVVKGGII